ncbi:glycosyltransferase family 4 protein [Ovoidimarina sediminis]|uniref:glycosyltransferase family 4 protein n=1 Tax=Ovoidimarina sediminis TaxID=3079856 RepID=UPI00290F6A35|nr:glycosyltransferase family 4 protein [Rhodophyticola sp. MJ-SS7]MDU8946141.1 glycosyltransferase family 4 protein [Rhodophyticola sp. MJ-SS7]
MLDYVPALEEAGFEVTIQSFFDTEYLTALYSGRRAVRSIAWSYVNRIRVLLHLEEFDAIWLEKEALPWVPAQVESSLLRKNRCLVTDFDDAVFHRYDRHPSKTVRRILGSKIPKLMLGSDVVFAGNAYLLEYARCSQAPRVEIVPTVVDLTKYRVPTLRSDGRDKPTIGWIGTPGTWVECVTQFVPMFENVLAAENARFVLVGAGNRPELSLRFERRNWSEDREVLDIHDMDIGVMPLPDTPWMRGKCGYKLIQYMACGLPIVASPVGVNREIVEHGVNGFLAESEAEWDAALCKLISDPDLRHRMGREGRKKVETEYSLQIQAPRVARLLRSAVQAALRRQTLSKS